MRPFWLLSGVSHAHFVDAHAQTEYIGLCGRLPAVEEFPAETVIDISKAEPKRPFWLSLRMCQSPRMTELDDTATKGKLGSEWWDDDVKETAEKACPPPV